MKYSMQHIPAICAQCRQNTAVFSYLKEAVQVSRHPFFFLHYYFKDMQQPFDCQAATCMLRFCHKVASLRIPKPTKTFNVFKAARRVKNLHCHEESCQEQNEIEVYYRPKAPMSMRGKGLSCQQNLQ